ncbi:MAG: hypothetical protein ACRCUY_13630 [Thermoguttaceae bacterium]
MLCIRSRLTSRQIHPPPNNRRLTPAARLTNPPTYVGGSPNNRRLTPAARLTNPPTYVGGSPNNRRLTLAARLTTADLRRRLAKYTAEQNNRFLRKRAKHGHEFCMAKIETLNG